MNSTYRFLLIFFTLTLLSPLAKSACNSPSAIDPALAASESECIQRVSENCVWASDTSAPSGFSCQECQTVPPPSEGKTISQCATDFPNDSSAFARCAAINTPTLSLLDFCYNVNHGRWKESGFSTEDRFSFDVDANDVAVSALYYEVKLSSQNLATPLLVSEVAVLSPNPPGGQDNVDLLIFNPRGITVVDEVATSTSTLSSEIKVIEDFDQLGFGFSTNKINTSSSYEAIQAAVPSLSVNYSYTATGIDASLLTQFSNGNINTSLQNFLFTNDNFLTRLEVRNKTKNYTTKDYPSIPRFFGLPEEIILAESQDYRTSLGLSKTATDNEIKQKILELNTHIKDIKTAGSATLVNTIKTSFSNNTNGAVLKIGLNSNGLFSKKNFKQFSIPKPEEMDVDGGTLKIPRSNTRSLNKNLSSYLGELKNGNIRNDREMISRNNIQNHLNKFSENNQMSSSIDSIIGGSCNSNSDCAPHEVCRIKTCICRKVECDGRADGKVDDYKWIIDPDGKLVIDKQLIPTEQREQIGSIFNDYVKDFVGENEGGSTIQPGESTNNHSITPNILTQYPPCNSSGCEHNLNLNSACNANGLNGTGVIHQFGNKMLTVTKYPTDTTETGTAECIKSDDREPEIHQLNFTCNSNGTINWANVDLSNCADFAERTFSCEEFGQSNVNVTQKNLTVFVNNDDNTTYEYQNMPFYFSKLSNQYELLANACTSGNANSISTNCIEDPNDKQCYGQFGHNSVNFPDQMFPTYLGNKKGILPGYQGTKKDIFTDTNVTWNYFLINPRYTGINSPSAILARRHDNISSLYTYETDRVDASPFNPTLLATCTTSPCRSQLDYDELAAFRATNAIKEFELLAPSSSSNRTNLHYYYDFLPTTFYGKGALPRIVLDYDKYAKKNNVIRTSYLNLYFSKSCEGGCENLVITSYEKCNELQTAQQAQQAPIIDTNTEYVCLPKYLDISLQLLDDTKDLFDIKGYVDVKIYDLVFRIHTDKKYSEAYNFYLDELNSTDGWTELEAKRVLDYLYPKALKYFDLANSSNDTDLSFSDTSHGDKKVINAFHATGGYHSLYKPKVSYSRAHEVPALAIPSPFSPDIAAPVDTTPGRSQWLSWFRQFSSAYRNGLQNRINSGATDNFKYTYNHLLQNYSLTWNPREQLRNIKRVFSIHDSESFHMYDTSIKASANGVVVRAGANNNIIHGVNIEGNSLTDFESYGFVFNEGHSNKKGYLVLSDISINSTEADNIKRNTYLMGHGVGSGNSKEQVRPDRISTDLEQRDFVSNFPLVFNLCETIGGNSITGTNACDKDNNYDDDGLYSPNQIFNPFFYENKGPEMGLSGPVNHYNNSVYFRNFHLKTNENWYLHAKDQEPIPITINDPVLGDNGLNYTQASFNLPTCNPTNELGKVSSNYSDAYCFRGGPDTSSLGNIDYGHYNSTNAETESLIISNSTLMNETSNAITFSNIDGADPDEDNHFTAFGGNYEFVSTTTIDALLFNNIFMNHTADILDLNFRDTGLRTDKNKNRIQVVERNIIAYGTQSKVTGLGTAEQIMKYSNNLVLKVPLGGYHGMFKSFYLHNAQATHGEVLDDSMDTPLMFDFHKPYGVRHSIYNSVMYLQENSIIYSSNSRPKQHGFDFNFNGNTFLGKVHDIWYNSNPGSVFNQAKTPLLKHDYISPLGCGDECSNISDETHPDHPIWNNRYGFLAGSNETLINNLGYNSKIVFNMYNGIFPYLSKGSLQNHLYIKSAGNTNTLFGEGAIDLDVIRNEEDYDQWGKILPFSETSDLNYLFEGKTLLNPLIGHTPRLYKITTAKDTGEPSQRVQYLWDYCYGNTTQPWQNEYSLVHFKNDIPDPISHSYRCITGDTQSDFVTSTDIKNLMDDIHTRFIDINHLGRDGANLQNRPTEQEITNLFDITKNTNNLNECSALKTIFESTDKKAPALHIDSTTLKTGLKLSVYRDWNGVYRKASTTRGPFEIVGNSITCSSP